MDNFKNEGGNLRKMNMASFNYPNQNDTQINTYFRNQDHVNNRFVRSAPRVLIDEVRLSFSLENIDKNDINQAS